VSPDETPVPEPDEDEEETDTSEAPAAPAEQSAPPAAEAPVPTPKRRGRGAPKPAADTKPAEKTEAAKPKVKVPKAPRRPTLTPEQARLLSERRAQDRRRPRFTRQASYRYYRIGRDESWRRPRGQQSKQRRHYGYRSTVVSIGFRGPRLVRGRTPSGFLPVRVRTPADVERIDPAREAALIARTVGTRRRLVLEETARKRGVHVLNPLTKDRQEA
jgi:large subunit ribosomal protein L32e